MASHGCLETCGQIQGAQKCGCVLTVPDRVIKGLQRNTPILIHAPHIVIETALLDRWRILDGQLHETREEIGISLSVLDGTSYADILGFQ